MKSTKRVYLDLDNTIVNTTAFHDALALAMEKIFGLSAQIFRAEIRQNYALRPIEEPVPLGYDLPNHLARYGIDFDNYREPLLAAFQTSNFVYADALTAIVRLLHQKHSRLVIITVGESRTQNFKLTMVRREIARRFAWNQEPNIESEVLLTDKGVYLAGILEECIARGEQMRFVDDNPSQFIGLDLENVSPENAQAYQIQRVDAKFPFTDQKGVSWIDSLPAVVC